MKNNELAKLIVELKKTGSINKAEIWRAVAKELEKPSRARRAVNLSKIERYAKDNDTVIVPGKVLGGGDLTKKVTVVAFQFSDQALAKITQNGKVMTLVDAMKTNPQGKNVRILG